MRDEVSFTFTQVVRRSFVLNGKRYTVEHKPLRAGTYRLERTAAFNLEKRG